MVLCRYSHFLFGDICANKKPTAQNDGLNEWKESGTKKK